jgi:hypothetical protein
MAIITIFFWLFTSFCIRSLNISFVQHHPHSSKQLWAREAYSPRVLLQPSVTASRMRALIILALAVASFQVIAAQAPRHLPSLMLPRGRALPPGSETSVASALMLPRDVAVVQVASSTGEDCPRSQVT